LQVSAAGTKSWVFRFKEAGKLREMGLGATHTIGLAEAREKARDCRRRRLDGIDPIEARKATRAQARLDAAKAMTFKQCAESYIASHKAGWRNPKHAAQWPSTLGAYVYPIFGALPVQAVDVGLVMRALEPIWTTKPETAGRVRGRIESVLDWAAARGYRQGENPARWRGHLDHLLPKRPKLTRGHHAAMAYEKVADFVGELRDRDAMAARALEFCILTAARSGEVLGARWSEVDLASAVWTVPAHRMKAGREHRVPLSDRAVAILRELAEAGMGDFVFVGHKPGRPLAILAMAVLLRRMRDDSVTTHGFRSSFRDWAGNETGYPRELIETALAHVIGDKAEQAYRRSDALEKRRQLMEAWASYCAADPTPKVVPFRGKA
jgi:integrase